MDLVGSSADNALRALSKDEPPKPSLLEVLWRHEVPKQKFLHTFGTLDVVRSVLLKYMYKILYMYFGMFPVAEGGRKLTNDVGRSPESFA